MCFVATQTTLQFLSSGIAGKDQESENWAAANNDSSVEMSAPVQVETGDMFRCYTQAGVNLKQHMLSQTFWNWGERKLLKIYYSLFQRKF